MSKIAIDRRMALFYMYFLISCVAIGACGYFFVKRTGIVTPQHSAQTPQLSYYDLPQMTVSLGGGGSDGQIMLDVSLGVSSEDMTILEGYQPKITDKLTWYLSQESKYNITHPQSTEWFRDELLRQVNSVGAPVKVRTLRLKELVIM